MDFISTSDSEDERLFEQKAVGDIKNLILRIGKEFCFIGNQYLGVATYRTTKEVPKEMEDILPNAAELARLL